jgi:hypothetical protein
MCSMVIGSELFALVAAPPLANVLTPLGSCGVCCTLGIYLLACLVVQGPQPSNIQRHNTIFENFSMTVIGLVVAIVSAAFGIKTT